MGEKAVRNPTDLCYGSIKHVALNTPENLKVCMKVAIHKTCVIYLLNAQQVLPERSTLLAQADPRGKREMHFYPPYLGTRAALAHTEGAISLRQRCRASRTLEQVHWKIRL